MISSRQVFYVLVAALIIIGLATAAWRAIDVGVPLWPGTQKPVWLVEARIDFEAHGDAVLASFNIPDDAPGFDLSFEHTASPGYGFGRVEEDGILRGEWSISEADGPQTLYYKIHAIPDGSSYRDGPPAEEPAEPPEPVWSGAEETAAEQVLERAKQASSTPQSLARQLIDEFRGDLDDNASLLLDNYERIEVLERLLHEAGIAARTSLGLKLEDGRRNQPPIPILEVYAGGYWVPFNPETGHQGVEEQVLLWHRGGVSLIDLFGGSGANVTFSMNKQSVPAEQLARMDEEPDLLSVLSVHQLPIEQQTVFKLLLLLPLGALVTVFLRIMVGIRTSGTFMPVLIALAFLQTELLAGLVSFVGIVSLGLLLRSYLSKLNLLLVARISTVIVIVVFLIGLLSLLGYQLGFATGMTLAFFPIIIIAWTIERMSILWEEEGPYEVLVQGSGSLIVALSAYALMSWPLLQHLTFNFPEINLIVVALVMLMGQYTGYRLLELRRFSSFQEAQR
ncbi:inactive transglutaminase family protein [Halorhodospira halochloris]|uniref:inactive transglutaminase family protein n=1 Tax=Halorhodospira halochloris TaxID=1052 RepID=UPI001EE8506F|nr:inactive transglutaminase family protein [Halorhodospira halochloris]MCG5529762.1 inactive transglutaminase family protein [Halorhodospira halochloris]